jgi:hypothetical protein
MRTGRNDEGMRFLMMLQAQPCPPRFGAMEVQGGWLCGVETQFGSCRGCCIGDVHGVTVW